jgi:hypothetical protein
MVDFAEKHVEFILEFRPVLFPIDGFNDTLVWTALVSSCLGYLLPSPTIKTKHVLLDFA